MVRNLAVLLIVLAGIGAASLAAGDGGRTVGLVRNDPGASDGYTLFKPARILGIPPTAYLIDNGGRLVHSWHTPSMLIRHLLEDGSVIGLTSQGALRLGWDGTLLWDFSYAGGQVHHDLAVLPNGNVLIIVRETKSSADAIAAGRDPNLLSEGALWPDSIIEVEPTGTTSGRVVWEWHTWDHLVQDFDPTKDNLGVVADHPELIDVNFIEFTRPPDGEADWHHANSINYNAELDQIMLSVRHFSEIWVIDHSTTTEEAASRSGGDSGRGGDLLYRWGNPQAYDAGNPDDQQLFSQHDARWIEPGLPGAGNILVFNNGNGRGYSSVEEIVPPVDDSGNYALTAGQLYGPEAPTWTYSAPVRTDFYAALFSSAIRLPNGNTLINDGPIGTLFEVTVAGETVWKYVNPIQADGPLAQDDPIPPDGLGVFRATRYPPDYPGLAGRNLTPGGPLEIVKPTPTPTITTGPDPTPTPTSTPGDADGDGRLTSLDALVVLQYDAGLLTSLPSLEIADVNQDGSITSIDAALILQAVAGLAPLR